MSNCRAASEALRSSTAILVAFGFVEMKFTAQFNILMFNLRQGGQVVALGENVARGL